MPPQDPPVVGMVGAGQLARMTHQAAIGLGLSLRVLAGDPAEAAAQVAPHVVGDYRSLPDLAAFAAACDVLTFDHEQVPGEHLAALAERGATVHPGPAALRYAQDKRALRERLADLGVPGPDWRPWEPDRPLPAAGVAKAVRGGYDGRGVWLLDEGERPPAGTEVLVEERVPIARELAALLARTPSGAVACWPVVETVQRGGICVRTVAPAPDPPAGAAELAVRVAEQLGVVGVLAVELFERTDGALLVNELAMRPHNSGHWTIEGALTSQFAQHLRAVLDWPLGPTGLRARWAVTVNLLGGDPAAALPRVVLPGGVAVHVYGKQPRPGRKLGHVTAVGDDLAETRGRAEDAAAALAAAGCPR